MRDLAARYPFLSARDAQRLIRLYGTRAASFLGAATSVSDLGEQFGHGLSAAEVDYLFAQEWAQTADDILWRRTKLGLYFTPEQTARLAAYITERTTSA
jgi:glycerol-3-phosphate dehydrogenase